MIITVSSQHPLIFQENSSKVQHHIFRKAPDAKLIIKFDLVRRHIASLFVGCHGDWAVHFVDYLCRSQLWILDDHIWFKDRCQFRIRLIRKLVALRNFILLSRIYSLRDILISLLDDDFCYKNFNMPTNVFFVFIDNVNALINIGYCLLSGFYYNILI